MRPVFAPGCALMVDRPVASARLLAHLVDELGGVDEHLTCCRHEPGLAAGTRVINVCPGCDRRYRDLYPGISTISLWEVLAVSARFPFPDYGEAEMAVLDACPTRTQTRVHEAIRALLRRMRIRAIEPERARERTVCCGDEAWGVLPVDRVKELMRRRAADMPREDVVVHCYSCVKAMHIGGRRPRHLVDLLLGEATPIGEFEPDAWHARIQAFIDAH